MLIQALANHSRDNPAGMKFIKILTYSLSRRYSTKHYGLSTRSLWNLGKSFGLPKRKYNLKETVEYTSYETVNQSSLLVKERSHSKRLEISHDRMLSICHGISRIVKRIDFKFLTSRFSRSNKGNQRIDMQEVFKEVNLFSILKILPKKLYLPFGYLQLFNIYGRNYYIRRLKGIYN